MFLQTENECRPQNFFNSKEFWSKGGWGCLSQMSVLLY